MALPKCPPACVFLPFSTTVSRIGDQVSDPEKGVMGTGAHSDYGMITMLATVSAKLKHVSIRKVSSTAPLTGRVSSRRACLRAYEHILGVE